MGMIFPAPRVFYDALRASWFEQMTAELTVFRDALETCLYELPKSPSTQWRERFDQFVADQKSAGRELTPEGQEEILAYLDDWLDSLKPTAQPASADNAKAAGTWPALSEEDRQRTRATYGLPGWYAKPLEWGDEEWEKVFENLGRESRDRMLEVCQQLSVLGGMARDVDQVADDGLDELASQKQRVQAAYDAYILSLVEIQRQWLDYINKHWFIGLQIQKLIARLEANLPPRLFDLSSTHLKALATVSNDVNKALGKVVSRLDTAYKTAVWTDRVIAVIEVATAIGAIGAGARLIFKAAVKKGIAKSVAIQMGVKYAVKQLAVQASTYVVAGYALPPLLAASGLNQDFVFTGLMVMQGLTTLYAVRSAKVAGGATKPGKTEKPEIDSPAGPRGDAPNPPKNPVEDTPSASPDSVDTAGSIARFIRRDFWKKTITFQGLKVLQNDDLIDPKKVTPDGKTNLQRMQIGLAPYGTDGKKISLHHLKQKREGPLFEVTRTFHEKHSAYLHPHGNRRRSEIDRGEFDYYREDYWKHRALDFSEAE
jgi:hypothetical protein